MVTREAIDAALTAHAQWKDRIEASVASRRSDFKPAVVAMDDACDFGRWMHTLRGDDILTEQYRTVKALHAQFHKAAAHVLTMALAGNGADAMTELAPGGDYHRIAADLVLAMTRWKEMINTP